MIPDVTGNVDKQAPEVVAGRPTISSSRRNVRMVEQVFPQRSPDYPRQGDTPARPARWPMFVSLAIADWQAVSDETFKIVRFGPEHQIQQLYGKQQPMTERANIARANAVAYGSLFELQPPQQYILR